MLVIYNVQNTTDVCYDAYKTLGDAKYDHGIIN